MAGVEISECCSETDFLYKRALRGKSGVIDRSLLTRKQHENLLAQPRPIPKTPPPPRRKVKQCSIPKICPPRVDQLAIPTQKLVEGVLQNFNKTLEAERVVRLVKLAHSNRSERPHYTAQKCRKKKKKKRKRSKKENCLKVWLKRRVKISAKLIMVQIRKRREMLPNYRQLLVSMGIFKLLKLKKKRNKCMCRYTRQYLMKICEQLAIICDTEFQPYKKPPPMEPLPVSEVESVESKKHIFWKIREVTEEKRSVLTEEEEGECTIEVEEEESMSEIEEERLSEIEEEEEREGKGESEMEFSPEEGPQFPPIKEEPPEVGEGELTEGEEGEGEFIPDVDTEDTGKEPETEGEEAIPEEESEGGVTDGEGAGEEAGDEDEGEAEEHGGAVDEVAPEEPGGGVEEIPPDTGIQEGAELGPEGGETVDEEEEMGEGEEELGEGEEAVEPEPPSEKPPSVVPSEEKPPSVVPSEEKPPSTVPSEEKPPSVVPSEEKPPSVVPSEEKPPSEVPSEEKPPSVKPSEEKPPGEGKPPSEKPSEEKPPSAIPSEEKPPTEGLVDVHPPGTVSYLTCQVYASWLDEFAANIQIYSKCLRNFREMLETRHVEYSDKITQVLNNWGTYLRDSWEFEKDMSDYLRGKPVTKCAKCGEYNLHNLPPDHEIPPELKVAVDSTVRWRQLLEEAERLCTMYTMPHEDTASLASHETIHIVDATLQSSDTSMYVFEDYTDKCTK